MFDLDVITGEQINQFIEAEVIPKKSDVITLKGRFSSCDNTYNFEIKSNGNGIIFCPDSFSDEEFTHEIEVEKLALEIGEAVNSEIKQQSDAGIIEPSENREIADEIIAEKLEEFFWEEINQTLEDPFFRSLDDESEWGEAVGCEYGDEGEFEEFLELCVLTEKLISNSDDYLIIYTETECDAAGISENGYYSERLVELVEIACQYFKPVGHRYDYNDGYYDRYSGYSMSSESINISLREFAKTPTREKMVGMIELRKKLTAMKVENEKIERLT
ncbi:MAG TPA: hypothetical protein PKY59_18005, partial [Pyrinomonadaceae bacterium]|nr:hypothetical protein [Pyrinomonadaceae bacterium]